MPEFVDPNKVLDELMITSDMVVADFGCGSGGWAIPLAKRLENGQVLAIDVQESALSALSGKAHLEGLNNIKEIVSDVENEIKGLSEQSCDIVLITDLLFQVEDKEVVFREAKRVLKEDGQVLVVEWTQDSPLGSRGNRLSAQEIQQIAEKVGFKLEKDFKAGDYHFALIFSK